MATLGDCERLIDRAFRAAGTRQELRERVARLLSESSDRTRLGAAQAVYLSILAAVQSGKRDWRRMAGIWRWLIRVGVAERAGCWRVGDFRFRGDWWVVVNHPENILENFRIDACPAIR